MVGRHEVYFESSTPLAASAEAFLTAFLLPAMSRGMGLRTPAAVCPRWFENSQQVRALAREWWRFSGGDVQAGGEESVRSVEGRGLLFGGGVDSFYTLLAEQDGIDYLIYIEGYDVSLSDRHRLEQVYARNRNVAEACGKELLTLRTNLRQHPEFRVISWELAAGAALAASAHLVRNVCGEVMLASSYSAKDDKPWGSHRSLDPAWSSNATRIIHHGAEHDRLDKVIAIAESPLVHKSLRVCWEQRDEAENCGVCEKCVRTQLEFYIAGALDKVQAFPRGSLAQRIDALPGVSLPVVHFYEAYRDRIEDPAIRSRISSLLVRSLRWRARHSWKRLPIAVARKLRRHFC